MLRGSRSFAGAFAGIAGILPLCATPAASQQSLPAIEVVSPTPIPATRRPRPVVTQPSEEAVAPAIVARPAPTRRARRVARVSRPRTIVRSQPTPVVVAAPAPPPVEAPATVPQGGIERAKIPANVQVLTSDDIARSYSPSVTDALNTRLGSVSVNDVSGNTFQQDISYRGFTASPVPGTPQGIAVYQQGVRINEAFGDVVNWDLIPSMAIDRTTVYSNNPAFGLNALGGALSIEMKNGFTYQGVEVDTRGGSFGRRQLSGQYGAQIGDFATYLAGDLIDENGFRVKSPARVRRVYTDLGYRGDRAEFHVNFTGASNKFGAAATTPIQLIDRNYGAVYTTPQTTNNDLAFVTANGRVDITPTWNVQGNVYFRSFRQAHVDGNDSDIEPCMKSKFLCLDDDAFPGYSSAVRAIRDPFGNIVPNILNGQTAGSIDRTWTQSQTVGGSVQTTNTDKILGHGNNFVLGASIDRGWTYFKANSELGYIQPDLTVAGFGIIYHSNVPGGVNEVALNARNTYYGVFALDTFDVTSQLSVTAGARMNIARIDLFDLRTTTLNGGGTYHRINPVVGATYKILPGVSAYAGYSEANRAPTPLELGCADPSRPCLIDNFLVSDPPLKQVVAKTIEAGLKGTFDGPPNLGGRFDWNAGVFRTQNYDDILNVPSFITGRGYFTNVGQTRRQGVEAGITWRDERALFFVDYAMVDATFRSAITLGSPNNPFADASGNIFVRPGNVIPSIPRHRIKTGFEFAILPQWKVGTDVIIATSQFLRGDEANLLSKVPGYATVNLHTSWQIAEHVQLYGVVNNLTNTRYYNFGTLFDTTAIPSQNLTDARSLSPGQPLAAYAGLKIRF